MKTRTILGFGPKTIQSNRSWWMFWCDNSVPSWCPFPTQVQRALTGFQLSGYIEDRINFERRLQVEPDVENWSRCRLPGRVQKKRKPIGWEGKSSTTSPGKDALNQLEFGSARMAEGKMWQAGHWKLCFLVGTHELAGFYWDKSCQSGKEG